MCIGILLIKNGNKIGNYVSMILKIQAVPKELLTYDFNNEDGEWDQWWEDRYQCMHNIKEFHLVYLINISYGTREILKHLIPRAIGYESCKIWSEGSILESNVIF